MNKIKKEIRLFKLLKKLKVRDLYSHFNNLNLLKEELEKTDVLLLKINDIIQENNKKNDKNLLSATFKNKRKVLNIMSSQKQIAENKRDFLLEQKNKTDIEISKILIQRDKIENKVNDKRLQLIEYKDLNLEANNRNFKKN